jgi:hypothetical protein
MTSFRRGDKVSWNTSQGTTHGVVEKTVTSTTTLGGTELKGTKDDPVYIVKSDKTGKHAGHKGDALERRT